MFSALAKAFGQLSDPKLRRVIRRAVACAAALFAGFMALVWWGLSLLRLSDLPALDWALDLLGGFAALVIALLLFPALTAIIASLFLEEVAAAVEARHYPALPLPRVQPWGELIGCALRFAGVVLGLNLLALPLYLVLLFVPPLNVMLYYGLNGYLLGREYFELVALRRVDARNLRGLRQAFAGRLLAAGIAIGLLSSLPILNLLTPLIATAFMVHIFETLRAAAGSTPDLPHRAGGPGPAQAL